jgi:2-C-methyl-D-erythritol 4-phosphate cytidylyltransferase
MTRKIPFTDVAAIVVAAGQGTRFGGDLPKQFLLLQNRPILVHALERLERAPAIGQIVVVVAQDWVDYIGREIIGHFHFDKVGAIVPGGKERQDSVLAGLQALPTPHDLVVVHDAVRPLFSLDLLERVIQACGEFDACVPACRRATLSNALMANASSRPYRATRCVSCKRRKRFVAEPCWKHLPWRVQ